MIKVPDDRILALPYDDHYAGLQDEVFVPLRGRHKRDWFSKHAYLCLPLVIGNQYGFAVKSLFQIQNFHFYFQMPKALISSQRGNHHLRQQLNG